MYGHRAHAQSAQHGHAKIEHNAHPRAPWAAVRLYTKGCTPKVVHQR